MDEQFLRDVSALGAETTDWSLVWAFVVDHPVYKRVVDNIVGAQLWDEFKSEADDVKQDIDRAIGRDIQLHIHEFSNRTFNLQAWFLTTIERRFKDQLRRLHRIKEKHRALETGYAEYARAMNQREQLRSRVRKLISTIDLPPEDEPLRVLGTLWISGSTDAEIAKEFQCEKRTVTNKKIKLKAILKSYLDDDVNLDTLEPGT